ncbi:hypothetical protein ACJ73_08052 [Blastomyces percursus]|uniref:Uncharacterized protein n=1 Tax=Blastomyces percursus TaxID=1658174 RepID=A0A1J9QK92_9EURO|nr:hypothetical protein ACJ73_08052 [Blastomyces percursus]
MYVHIQIKSLINYVDAILPQKSFKKVLQQQMFCRQNNEVSNNALGAPDSRTSGNITEESRTRLGSIALNLRGTVSGS